MSPDTGAGRSSALSLQGRVVRSLVAVVLFLLLVLAPQASAATITPNTTADELNSDGDCSLREAIQATNTDASVDTCTTGSGSDTITLPAGTYTLAIAGGGEDANATGDIDITSSLNITGAGAASTIVDGADLDRVVHVIGATVAVRGLTIRNGSTSDLGGGIGNIGTLSLSDSSVSGNTAGLGGGIFNGGTLTINDSSVSGNASNGGGGIYGPATLNHSNVSQNASSFIGGGIQSSGGLILNESTVSDNTASSAGGGIHDSGQGTTLNRSSVSSNSAGMWGGGIWIENPGFSLNSSKVTNNSANSGGGIYIFRGSGVLSATDSTISGNTADTTGGGIYNQTTGTAITNSTISRNSAGRGGGIYNEFDSTLTITSSTFSGNTAVMSGGGMGGITTPRPILKNTIVANSSPNDCENPNVTSAGHNLDSDGTCGFAAPGDLQNTDPMLAPLQDNGGPTETHLPLTGSPAIDAGSPDCPPPATDQRGIARPQGAACDIGAVEAVLNSPPDCSPVSDNPNGVWPPNHKLRLVSLGGATDPDGDSVTLVITAVTQDEPLNGVGDGDTSPDARAATQSSKVLLRAERSGRHDGRVYRISFTGSDGRGGSCSGIVTVGVPKNMGPGSVPIDSAPPSFDSFGL